MAIKTRRQGTDPVDVVAELLRLIGKSVFVPVWWAVLFPMISLPLVGAVAVWVLLGSVPGVVVVGVSIAGMVLWRQGSPQTFERWITRRARARYLTWWRYRRRWARLLKTCHLTVVLGDTTLVPPLLGTDIGDTVDRVRVEMLHGQCPTDYENCARHIAHAVGARYCRTRIVGPAIVELALHHADSLTDTADLSRVGARRWTGRDAA